MCLPEPGERITGVRGDTYSEASFMGRAGGYEFAGCNDGVVETPAVDGRFVRQFHIIADTGAGDVSDDENYGCDTQIRRIDFNTVTIELEPIR